MNNLEQVKLAQASNDQENLKSAAKEASLMIHFRCPECSKLYSSNPEKIYVENPEYTCNACNTEFSVSLIQALENSEVVGVKTHKPQVSETLALPIKETAPVVEPEPEPESVEVQAQKTVEALVEEFKEVPKSKVHFDELADVKHANTLELLWRDVLSDYDNREAHSAFIKTCQTEGQLEFAFQMYGNILRNNPNDRVAKSFVAKMKVNTEVEAFVDSEKSKSMLTTSFYVTLAIVATGLALILMGLVFGENKNIAGLGIALIFFTFAVKAFFQPRRPSVD